MGLLVFSIILIAADCAGAGVGRVFDIGAENSIKESVMGFAFDGFKDAVCAEAEVFLDTEEPPIKKRSSSGTTTMDFLVDFEDFGESSKNVTVFDVVGARGAFFAFEGLFSSSVFFLVFSALFFFLVGLFDLFVVEGGGKEVLSGESDTRLRDLGSLRIWGVYKEPLSNFCDCEPILPPPPQVMEPSANMSFVNKSSEGLFSSRGAPATISIVGKSSGVLVLRLEALLLANGIVYSRFT